MLIESRWWIVNLFRIESLSWHILRVIKCFLLFFDCLTTILQVRAHLFQIFDSLHLVFRLIIKNFLEIVYITWSHQEFELIWQLFDYRSFLQLLAFFLNLSYQWFISKSKNHIHCLILYKRFLKSEIAFSIQHLEESRTHECLAGEKVLINAKIFEEGLHSVVKIKRLKFQTHVTDHDGIRNVVGFFYCFKFYQVI